ncbi:hypothetical protein Lal_00021455 [Lupinus albus]|nr:hypothetical protein Lal_00021455 [Lupinus albus]
MRLETAAKGNRDAGIHTSHHGFTVVLDQEQGGSGFVDIKVFTPCIKVCHKIFMMVSMRSQIGTEGNKGICIMFFCLCLLIVWWRELCSLLPLGWFREINQLQIFLYGCMINSNVREGKLNDALFGLVDLRSLPEFIVHVGSTLDKACEAIGEDLVGAMPIPCSISVEGCLIKDGEFLFLSMLLYP